MKQPICEICKKDTRGRGQYSFRYLDETIYLCGYHAQLVMKFIKKGVRRDETTN